jgi:hypothetical protein
MSRRAMGWLAALAAMVVLSPFAAVAQEGDAWTLQAMDMANGVLKAQWMDLRIEQIEMLSLRQPRVISRLHWQPFQWVSGDPRRSTDGNRLTYLVDRKDGPGAAALPAGFEAAIDGAVASWAGLSCTSAELVKRQDTGEDADIFDFQLGFGGFGNWQTADVVFGGWMPPSFFEAVAGRDAGTTVLAMSVTFIFVGPDGAPTDIDGDQHYDTALNEIYLNDGFSWGMESGFDVETVALHEFGHSLGLGHFEHPPQAVMNPVYTGLRRELHQRDEALACSVWSSWRLPEEQ